MTQPTNPATLLDNKAGDCRILPGGVAYCTGVLPNEGFDIVRVLLRPWLSIERGYAGRRGRAGGTSGAAGAGGVNGMTS